MGSTSQNSLGKTAGQVGGWTGVPLFSLTGRAIPNSQSNTREEILVDSRQQI